MVKSMNEYLQEEMQCEGLLECIYGLKRLDRDVYHLIADRDRSLSVDEIADLVGRERSTAYRSVQRLRSAGFIQQDQVNYEHGGYHYEYRLVDPDQVADNMQRVLNDWYAKMGQLLSEFRETYAGHPH